MGEISTNTLLRIPQVQTTVQPVTAPQHRPIEQQKSPKKMAGDLAQWLSQPLLALHQAAQRPMGALPWDGTPTPSSPPSSKAVRTAGRPRPGGGGGTGEV